MRVRKNRWLTKISKHTGESEVSTAVEILVDSFRTSGETLSTLVYQLGIQEILCEPLPFDGGVYEIHGKRIIRINSLAPPIRQTFTLAHEAGHLILERSVKGASSCSADNDLERACNCVAAELLMPARQVTKVADELGRQSPEKLSPIANRFGVSLQTAAQRLHDLRLWKWGMGMWKCEPMAKQKWFVGKRPWKTDTPTLSAFDLAIESSSPVRTTEHISKGAYTEAVALKAYHIGKQFVIAVVATAGQ
ncbi:MAG TPA: ImmA/IrrE family metallo-endopeptidase [Terriglobales bacterium]|jgi:Zn-dependent peptidase ImmA (M78 family)